MKNKLTNILFIPLLILFFIQCKKDNLMTILKDAEVCLESNITDSLSLDNVLTGKWELAYYECETCNEKLALSGDIIFEKETGELTLFEYDVFLKEAFSWTIEPVVDNTLNPPSGNYHIVTEPKLNTIGTIDKICESYIAYDNRMNDGGYYIFKKL